MTLTQLGLYMELLTLGSTIVFQSTPSQTYLLKCLYQQHMALENMQHERDEEIERQVRQRLDMMEDYRRQEAHDEEY